jgi:hypothetical protein
MGGQAAEECPANAAVTRAPEHDVVAASVLRDLDEHVHWIAVSYDDLDRKSRLADQAR